MEILAYRRVLTYVLNVATEPGFALDEAVLRSMHFMLLDHDLTKTPGRYRTTEIFMRDDKRGVNVYEGPDGGLVPERTRARKSVGEGKRMQVRVSLGGGH